MTSMGNGQPTCCTVSRNVGDIPALDRTHLAAVVDEELLVHHPVIGLHTAVKELGCDVILDAVGLATQLELQKGHHIMKQGRLPLCTWHHVTGSAAAAFHCSVGAARQSTTCSRVGLHAAGGTMYRISCNCPQVTILNRPVAQCTLCRGRRPPYLICWTVLHGTGCCCCCFDTREGIE
mgnify:CR=1 FL=1